MIDWIRRRAIVDRLVDFVVGELFFVFIVAYSLYGLLFLNVEGMSKVALVISLMLAWGLLFAQWFVRAIKYFSKEK